MGMTMLFKRTLSACAAGALFLSAMPVWSQEQIAGGPILTHGVPMTVAGVETVCTGIDADSRNNPNWTSYPAKLEFAAANGAYLAYAEVSVAGQGAKEMFSVRCPGAWLLMRLSAGTYTATVSVQGQAPQKVTLNVPKTGQVTKTAIFQTPNDGGAASTQGAAQ
jgi:hypothetical protein